MSPYNRRVGPGNGTPVEMGTGITVVISSLPSVDNWNSPVPSLRGNEAPKPIFRLTRPEMTKGCMSGAKIPSPRMAARVAGRPSASST